MSLPIYSARCTPTGTFPTHSVQTSERSRRRVPGGTTNDPTRNVRIKNDYSDGGDDGDDKHTAKYAFPIAPSSPPSVLQTPREITPKRTRRRPRASSNGLCDGPDTPIASIRFSNSSAQSQAETPPQTPDDLLIAIDFTNPATSSKDPSSFPVVVSPPVPGVETMDALVDGMNGFESDDFFMNPAALPSPSRSTRKDRFHPLYQPPLPTPPPGITLGGALPRKPSKPKRRPRSVHADSSPSQLPTPPSSSTHLTRLEHPRPSTARLASSSTGSALRDPPLSYSPSPSPSSLSTPPFPLPIPIKSTHTASDNRDSKSVVPSISDIIRAYAPPEQQIRSRQTSVRTSIIQSSQGHSLFPEFDNDPESGSPLALDDADVVSRSSVDSITDEVRRTLRTQSTSPTLTTYARSLPSRYSFISDGPLGHEVDSPAAASPHTSLYSSSSPAAIDPLPPPIDFPVQKPSQDESIAQYLRSARLTTLLKLTRAPHASFDNPLTVSLSDLGSPNGVPLVVFLGLGSVRYVMGLYDEIAECLGIRLITIDRWGLGRTESPKQKSARGILVWASVVEEVLDQLGIERCSVMAHSAGAPYALSFANKVPDRICGNILLLAPWVGGIDAGYKWLKYVPNGILKAAQGAEWKLQAWMLGKPPTITYQGIGYDAATAVPSMGVHRSAKASRRHKKERRASMAVVESVEANEQSHASRSSSVFSDYDDLRDFEGRFDSPNAASMRVRGVSDVNHPVERKTSRGFLGLLKTGSSNPTSPVLPASYDKYPNTFTHGSTSSNRRPTLKALRSMGSLRNRSATYKSRTPNTPPRVPQPLKVDIGLGIDGEAWMSEVDAKYGPYNSAPAECKPILPRERRAQGRRSVSLASVAAPPSLLSSPVSSTNTPPSPSPVKSSAYQMAFGNALIAASHAEASRGTHSDLLQILNHDQAPWGFSYTTYPHRVRVWYGDRDEKIAENAVRWMERNMGEGQCVVQVVPGADHGLMYRSSVIIDVLERVRGFWDGVDSSR